MFKWIFHSDLFSKIGKTMIRINPQTDISKLVCVYVYITYIYYVYSRYAACILQN